MTARLQVPAVQTQAWWSRAARVAGQMWQSASMKAIHTLRGRSARRCSARRSLDSSRLLRARSFGHCFQSVGDVARIADLTSDGPKLLDGLSHAHRREAYIGHKPRVEVKVLCDKRGCAPSRSSSPRDKDLTIRIDDWSGGQVNVDGTPRVEILIPVLRRYLPPRCEAVDVQLKPATV